MASLTSTLTLKLLDNVSGPARTVAQALHDAERAAQDVARAWPAPGQRTASRPRYGERRAIVEGGDWEGPSFQTCMNAAATCKTFETYRRREALSFRHHAEADALLDWCEETLAEMGKCAPRERRAFTAAGIPPRQAP
jgi:hypothetical protein